jgi:hypothetical protein
MVGAAIPNTVGVLNIVVDLRARQVTCSVDIDAPREGKSTTKVNWLVRQLKSANDKARLESTVLSQRGTGASDLLGRVREKSKLLILDPRRTSAPSPSPPCNRWDSKAAEERNLHRHLPDLHRYLLHRRTPGLKAWSAKPPRMREQTDVTDMAKDQEVAPALVSTALSSQDGVSLVEAPSTVAPLATVS